MKKVLLRVVLALLVVVGAFLVVLMNPYVVGCGPADSFVDMPPLRVEGRLLDDKGQPVANEGLIIGTLDHGFWSSDILQAIRAGKRGNHDRYATVFVATDTEGRFSYTFDKRFRLQPVALVFGFALGESQERDLHLLVATDSGKGFIYCIEAHETDVESRILYEERSLPEGFRALAERSEVKDSVEIELVLPSGKPKTQDQPQDKTETQGENRDKSTSKTPIFI